MLSLPRWHLLVVFTLLFSALLAFPSKTAISLGAQEPSGEPVTRLVSVTMDGGATDGASIGAVVSADGRYVAFTSGATNLVLDDTNERTDVFVRDMVEGVTVRVSVASDGSEANGASQGASISRDGRYVAFSSSATNLVFSDTNGLRDVFVRDLTAGTTTRVSMGQSGAEPDGDSRTPSISGNGAVVAFISGATNLVTDDEPGEDVFVADLTNGLTERVSDNFRDRERGVIFTLRSPALSESGRLVTFTGWLGWTVAEPPVCIMRARDRQMHTDDSRYCGQTSVPATISANGVFVTYAECINNEFGRAFFSCFASGGLDVVNLMDSTTSGADWTWNERSPNDYPFDPTISRNGRYVAYRSAATNLVREPDTNGNDDVFVRDRYAGDTIRVSVAHDGAEANGSSGVPMVSEDGEYVVYQSHASSLAPDDSNEIADVFITSIQQVIAPTATPTHTRTSTHTATATPTGTATFAATPSHTATRTATIVGEVTPTRSPTGSLSPTGTRTIIATAVNTPTGTRTVSPTVTPTPTATQQAGGLRLYLPLIRRQ